MPTPIKKKPRKTRVPFKNPVAGDPPAVGPRGLDKVKVKKLKDKINRLESSFKMEERILRDRGLGTFTQSMRKYSEEATKLNNQLIKLTGKGSTKFESKRKNK